MAAIVARPTPARSANAPATPRGAPSRRLGCAVAFAATCMGALPAQADDIDVYTARIAGQKKPNVLFVLDYSGSMNEDIAGGDASESGLPRKIDVLHDAMEEVLEKNVGAIRAGIGSIYDGVASGVRWPVSELDADAHDIDSAIPENALSARAAMLTQLERREAGGATRTVNALVEAAMYFRGGTVANGGADPRNSWRHAPDSWDATLGRYDGGNRSAAIAASYTPSDAYWRGVYEDGDFGWCYDHSESGGHDGCAARVTYDCEYEPSGRWEGEGANGTYGAHRRCRYEHPDHWSGASYDSPIEGQCQTNAIVLISDGLPDRYEDTTALREVIGMDPSGCESLDGSVFTDPGYDKDGDCGPEVVRALAENPQVAGIPDSTVQTYAVGFGVDGVGQDYLDLLGREGGGGSYSASNGAELSDALTRSIADAIGGSESFVELSVDVDKASFSHDERAYFSLFTPSASRAWSGNLKGYFVDADGFDDINGANAIVTGDDPDTDRIERGARFAKDAQSFWSEDPDGNAVSAGGASEQLLGGGRNLYTWLGVESSIGTNGAPLATDAAHRIEPGNGALDGAWFDAGTTDAERAGAIAWLQTAPMGDPLHSKSVSIDYGTRQVVYVMTNQGLLHAIDATRPGTPGAGDTDGGEELFAFMPSRLLKNLPDLASGTIGDGHVYGLDGATTRWHEDGNNDGIVNGSDTVLLVFGMRRGGNAYYALDVTDPLAPKLAWVIDGEMSDFAGLAQTWSRASLVNVRRGTGTERVLMFGGGYDPALDDTDVPPSSDGNAVFVVDRAGRHVRTFADTAMTHAIPADLTVIDSDSDGLADRIYAADLGGEVWRIDFDDIASPTDSRITRLASLAETGAPHRFFSAPSVALNRSAAGDFLSVALGSGNRTDPLDDESENAFFVLRDTDVEKGVPAATGTPIRTLDLYDATSDALSSTDAATSTTARDELEAAAGWIVRLERGEKSLSRLVSFEGQLMATTFEPDGVTDDPCAFGATRRFYRMSIADAAPLIDADDTSSDDDGERRFRRIEGSMIPSAPVVLFPKGSSTVQIIVDKERVDLIEQRLTRVYWHAK